jgi:UDP-N-acetylglucosamine 2-epimerase (non-hydrolysing)
MKFALIIGTRPEITKTFTIAKEALNKLDFTIIFSGQQYDYEMSKAILEDLQYPEPNVYLDILSGDPYKLMSNMIFKLNEVLKKEKIDAILVEGDVHTVLVAAINAIQNKKKLFHIESGCRGYDLAMQEEYNRIVVDHLSDILFAPTKDKVENLIKEHISKEKIFVSGDTQVDIIYDYALKLIEKRSKEIISKFNVEPKTYSLLTLHRAQNVDYKDILSKILTQIGNVNSKIIFPIHPRTKQRILQFGIKLPSNLTILNPLNYSEFLSLQANANFVMTDSGGIQEESALLKIPCFTLRQYTEWTETVKAGSNILVGTDEKISKTINSYIDGGLKFRFKKDVLGEKGAGKRIVKFLSKW